MSLEQFINLLATILGAIGSVYVLKSYIQQTPSTTERIAGSRLGHNLELLDTLSAQRAEGVTGSGLIVLTLVIAIVNSIVSPAQIDFLSSKLYALPIFLLLSVLVYFGLSVITKFIYLKHLHASASVIAKNTLTRVIQDKNIPLYETKSLYLLSKKFFKLDLEPKSKSRDFLQSLGKYLGIEIPNDVKIEEER